MLVNTSYVNIANSGPFVLVKKRLKFEVFVFLYTLFDSSDYPLICPHNRYYSYLGKSNYPLFLFF